MAGLTPCRDACCVLMSRARTIILVSFCRAQVRPEQREEARERFVRFPNNLLRGAMPGILRSHAGRVCGPFQNAVVDAFEQLVASEADP